MKPDSEKLTHIDEDGKAQMVDVGCKDDTNRSATASGKVFMDIETIDALKKQEFEKGCLLYTSPSPRDLSTSRMPSSA